jgi:integrase
MSVKVRERLLKNGDTAFYIDVYWKGRRAVAPSGLRANKSNRTAYREAKKEAEIVAANRQRELVLESEGMISLSKRNRSFITFVEQLANEHGANRSYHNWLTVISHLKKFSNNTITFGAISVNWLDSFKAYLLTQVGQSTAHAYLSKVRAAINTAYRRGFIQTNVADKSQHIPKVQARREFLTLNELSALAATPARNEQVKLAFLFCCFTGLRHGDLRALKFGNVHGQSLRFVMNKTGEEMILPLSTQASSIIAAAKESRAYHGGDASVFILPSLTVIERVLKQWSVDAGIGKHITFHTSRHTFATLTLTLGADLYTVSKLLGHKSIQTTQIYAKVVDEKKSAAVALLPTIEIDSPPSPKRVEAVIEVESPSL